MTSAAVKRTIIIFNFVLFSIHVVRIKKRVSLPVFGTSAGDNSRCAYSCSARTYLYRGGTGRGTNFGTTVHTYGMYVCALYDARIFSFCILKTTSFQTVPKTTLAHTERI